MGLTQGSGEDSRETRKAAGTARTFYRIVLTNPPTEADFLSNQAKGLPLRHDTEEARRLWDGISAFDTEARARRMALRYPQQGGFVAELRISASGAIRFERSTATRGHYTLWGEPADLLASVVAIVPV